MSTGWTASPLCASSSWAAARLAWWAAFLRAVLVLPMMFVVVVLLMLLSVFCVLRATCKCRCWHTQQVLLCGVLSRADLGRERELRCLLAAAHLLLLQQDPG